MRIFTCQTQQSLVIVLDNYAIFYTNIPCGSRVMNIFTNSQQPAEMMLSKPLSIKKGCYTCQWLDNVDMYLYAKCDQNMPCSSKIMSIFTNC